MSAMTFYRISRRLQCWRVPLLPQLLYYLNFLLFNASIPPSANIGRETRLGYGGMGIVIHPRAVVGSRTLISQQVTIGGRSGHRDVPVIGDDVLIGAGARVLGPVRVGHGARIGANAVVLRDVPNGGVAVGVPARVVRIDEVKRVRE